MRLSRIPARNHAVHSGLKSTDANCRRRRTQERSLVVRWRHVLRISTVLLIASSIGVRDTTADGTSEPGPHPADFKLLNNGSGIDEYTGSLSWRYELLTVPGRGGLDFPVYLNYHSGIGCEQEASWVGLGFGLNLGSIERSIVYIPDDMMLYHNRSVDEIHQHDGWLFDDNYDPLRDSAFTDAPDMWTVALTEFGSNLVIVADSMNIFRNGGTPYGPAGKSDRAIDEDADASWLSPLQRSYGLILRIGSQDYVPSTLNLMNNERQRHCYVSPRMGDTIQGRIYEFSGELKLAFNDTTVGYSDNSGQCSVYVYKMPANSSDWEVSGPFSIEAANGNWLGTNVSVGHGDRFALLVKSRKFLPTKWAPWQVDYDISFTDWNGYYLNPEIYSDPNKVWHQGYTPRISSFALRGNDGATYQFGVSDYITATSRKCGYYFVTCRFEDSVSVAFDYSYRLTAILSPDYVDSDGNGIPSAGDCGNWIRIVYDSLPTVVNYANKNLRAFNGVFGRWDGQAGSATDSVWQWHHIHYPRYIETPTHRLDLLLSRRQDNLGYYGAGTADTLRPKKLDSLVLYLKTPDDDEWLESIAMTYADESTRPTDFESWADGECLGWHTFQGPGVGASDSTGKLTLLNVTWRDANDKTLPELKFEYTTNPRYEEQEEWGYPNENADYYSTDPLHRSYYFGGFEENWGYYRRSVEAKPGVDQQAWSIRQITYPTGGKETITWESNKYLWWGFPGIDPPGADLLYYRSEGVIEGDGVERGGIRVRTRSTDGGTGSDSPIEYFYGEGITSKPQTPAPFAFWFGFVGNSQEVGYRSVQSRFEDASSNTGVTTCFTNGSSTAAYYQDGLVPVPPVDQAKEGRPDYSSNGLFYLEGTRRGLPFLSSSTNEDGAVVSETETSYESSTIASLLSPILGNPSIYLEHTGVARSIWVRPSEVAVHQYDQHGLNPVLFTTTYDYDSLNGRLTRQTDSLGNGVSRILSTQYLHDQDTTLSQILTNKNILNLPFLQEVQQDHLGDTTIRSKAGYDYRDFGEERVYPWHKYDYKTIGTSPIIDTTTFVSYDQYGNVLQRIDPAGTSTSFNWGYSGTQMVLQAPKARPDEVSFNGFEDSLTFDDWQFSSVVLSGYPVYTGAKAARLTFSLGRIYKEIDVSTLDTTRLYVFSAWSVAPSQASARIRARFDGGPWIATDANYEHAYHRLEIVISIPGDAQTLELEASQGYTTSYASFDDLRFHPVDCPMTTYAYDHRTGQLEAAFDANNVAWERYYYDGFGRLSEIKDPDGDVLTRFVYHYSRDDSENFDPDNPNYVKEIRFNSPSDSSVAVTFYDGLGREIQRQLSEDADSRIVSATFYNYAGQVAVQTKPISYDDPQGSMDYASDLVPSNWTVGNSLGPEAIGLYYDGDPGPACHGYPFTEFKYSEDPLRRLVEIGQPDTTWEIGSGRTVRTEYLTNAAGDVAGWDAGTLSKVKRTGESGLVSYEYRDRLGRIVQTQVDSLETDSKRFKTRFVYDIRGNLIESYRQRSATDIDTTTYQYDALGQLTKRTTPDGGEVSYLYDQQGNLRFVEDPNNAALNWFIYYKYDALGRKIEEGIFDDESDNQFTQANANDRAFPTSTNTVKFTYRYDSALADFGRGRLASWKSGDGKYSRQFAYDAAGRVSTDWVKTDRDTTWFQYEYDWQGAVVAVTTESNEPGQPSHVEISYTYDKAHRLSGVGDGSTASRYATMTYWPNGRLRQETFYQTPGSPCQQVDYRYNPRDWLLAINSVDSVAQSKTGTGDHYAEEIGYCKSFNGNPDTILNEHSQQTRLSEIVSYDRIDRIAHWHQKEAIGTSMDLDFAYDRAGNIVTRKKSDGPSQYWYSYYEGTNRLKRIGVGAPDALTDYTWDANGNLKNAPNLRYHWEYRNLPYRIMLVHPNWTNHLDFVYDADSRRVKKEYYKGRSCDCGPDPLTASALPDTVTGLPVLIPHRMTDSSGLLRSAELLPRTDSPPSDRSQTEDTTLTGSKAAMGPIHDCVCYDKRTTRYIRTHDGRVMRVLENGDFARDFIYAGDRRIAVYEAGGPYGNLHYFLSDHLGSTRALLDSTGAVKAAYDFYPYGTLKFSLVDTDTKMQYTGKELDDEEIRQHYFGARYLDDATLRFSSIDPEERMYPGWSPYVYSLANPVRLKDLGGETVIDGVAGFAEAVITNLTPPPLPGTTPAYTRMDMSMYPSEGRSDFLAGRIAGDAAVMLAGASGFVIGGSATIGSVALVPTTGGAAALSAAGTGAATVGALSLTVRAGANLGTDLALLRQGNKGEGQTHHIATDKSDKSGYTARLKGIFDKGGLSLQDKANKVFLEGHKGPHNPKYHEFIIRRLTAATKGLSGDTYASALKNELAVLREEIESNPGLLKGEGL